MALAPITTVAVLNPAVQEINRIAAQLSEDISAQQQSITPATPIVPTPTDVPDNAISTIAGVMAGNVGTGDTTLAVVRPELAAAIERDQQVAERITADLRASLELSPVQADILSDAILVNAAAQKTIDLQRDSVDMQAQNSTIRANRAAGGVERQTALLAELKAEQIATREKEAERADILDDRITGLSIIDGVINSFRSFQVDLELEASREAEASTENQIRAITASTQNVATATQLTKETINKSTIAANQDKITAAANIEQVKSRIAMIHSNAQIMGTLLSASRSQVSNLVSLAQIRNSDESQQLARERLALTRQQMEGQRLLNDQRFRQGEITIARTQISLAIEQNLSATEVAFRERQLQNLILSGETAALALAEGIVTSDSRVSEVLVRSEAATVALEQAEAVLDRYIGTDDDFRANLALSVQQAQVTLDATTFELAVAKKDSPRLEAARAFSLLLSQQQLVGAERVNRAGEATEAGAIEVTLAENEQRVRNVRDTEEYYDFVVPLVQEAQAMLYGEGDNVEPRGAIIAGISPGATPESRAKYDKLADIGATEQIGDTPFDAAINLAAAVPSGNIPRGKTTALISDIQAEFNDKLADPNVTANTPEEQSSLFNETAKEVMIRHGKNIKSGDVTNPFHAIPLSALEIGFSSIQKDPLYTKVLKPAGITESRPDKIVEQAIAGIQSRTISAEQAVDGLVLIYESAIDHNNTFEGGFQRIGLLNQGSYLTMLPTSDTPFSSLVSDFFTPAGVTSRDLISIGAGIAGAARENPLATAGTVALGALLAGTAAVPALVATGLVTLGSQFIPETSSEVRVNMADFNEVKAYITTRMNSLPLKANASTGE